MQHPDYTKYDFAPPQQPERPKRNWGGYRPNAGRKHSWSKADYPLTNTALPKSLVNKLKTLRDSGMPVEDMIFRLSD